MKIKVSLNFIEVCAGCGGLSSGFIRSGFRPLLLNEKDKNCCETLKINHEKVDILCDDMRNIDIDEYIDKRVDILMGGVPCQSFSLAGKRKGLKDERGHLILDFCNMVSSLNPKIFLIENVKGLLYHNKGETFKHILDLLNGLGNYKIYYKILNSNNYSVPQKRERLFIIGINNKIKKVYEFPEEHKYKPILKDVLLDVPPSKGYEYSERKREIMEMVPAGGCWVDLPVKIQKEYMKKSYYSKGGKRGICRRLSMDEPSLTLLTSPSQKQTERCHPIETRPLNIREYARIQTFPDNYEFYGSISSQYKQIGNAVPVKLAEAIADSLIKMLR